ncbi:helix-turn-helix domain-containing protein [Streptomyces sp. NPDC003395]
MRYTLRDLGTFKKIMEAPGRGVPYSVRDLAEASGVSRSQIGRLLTNELNSLDVVDAHAIAEALGVAVLVLFMPPASPK